MTLVLDATTTETPRTVREELQAHFDATGFSTQSYTDRWSGFPFGPLYVVIRNWPARGRALSLHDLHHSLTGYDTSVKGEAELGAYEIASGCGRHVIAWVLQHEIFSIGLVIAPRATWRAFHRGRSGGTFYALPRANDELLARPLGEVRAELGLDREPPPPTWRDRLAFTLWALLSVPRLILSALVIPTVGALLILALHAWYRIEGQTHDAFGIDD